MHAEKHHVEAKGTNVGPNKLGPGKIQSCDWSVSLENILKFSEVQLNEKPIKTVQLYNYRTGMGPQGGTDNDYHV